MEDGYGFDKFFRYVYQKEKSERKVRKKSQKGYRIMAIAFGIISIVLGVIGGFLAGWIGVGVTALFGALAIFIGIRRNKAAEQEGKKVGALICGIVGIVIAFLLQLGVMSFADKLKQEADQLGDCQYVSAGAEGFKTLGFIGFMSNSLKQKPEGMSDSEFGDILKDQMSKVSDSLSGKK